jgi:hypothetical protein
LFGLTAVVLLIASTALGAGGAGKEVHRCHGRVATIVGTSGDDVLHAT